MTNGNKKSQYAHNKYIKIFYSITQTGRWLEPKNADY